MNGRKIVLSLCSLSLISSAATCRAGSILGVAAAYNLVALTGSVTDNGDIGGRVAAAGQVNVSSVEGAGSIVNDPNSALAAGYELVANGGITGDQVHAFGSENLYAPGATSSNYLFESSPHGSLLSPASSPINFTSLNSQLDSETSYLTSLAANGQATLGVPGYNPSWLVLSGTNSLLDVFDLTAAQLSNVNNPIDIVVPAGATVIINVAGTSDSLASQINLNGSQLSNTSDAASNILFNFSSATSLALNAELNGAVLAPYATVTGGSEVDGTIVAAQINITGEVDNAEFTGSVPSSPGALVPEPGSLMLCLTGILGVAALLRAKKGREIALVAVTR